MGAYNNPYRFTWPANSTLNVQVVLYGIRSQIPSQPGDQELSFQMSIPGIVSFLCNNYHPEMPTAWNPTPVPYDQIFTLEGKHKGAPPNPNLQWWDMPAIVTLPTAGQLVLTYYDVGNDVVPTPQDTIAIVVGINWHSLQGKNEAFHLVAGGRTEHGPEKLKTQ